MTINAIIFDFGNVISNFDYTRFHTFLAAQSDKTPAQIKEILNGGVQDLYERGLISSDDFYRTACQHCGVHTPKKDFRHAYNSIFSPNLATLSLIGDLRGTYKLGLLSNVSEWHYYDHVQPLVEDHFDTVTTSFQVGVLKPNDAIYLDALHKLRTPAEECAYIDDIADNAQAAKALGMHGIHYQSHQQLLTELHNLGVDVPKD